MVSCFDVVGTPDARFPAASLDRLPRRCAGSQPYTVRETDRRPVRCFKSRSTMVGAPFFAKRRVGDGCERRGTFETRCQCSAGFELTDWCAAARERCFLRVLVLYWGSALLLRSALRRLPSRGGETLLKSAGTRPRQINTDRTPGSRELPIGVICTDRLKNSPLAKLADMYARSYENDCSAGERQQSEGEKTPIRSGRNPLHTEG